VWVPKAIVIASRYPYYDFFQQILEDFWQKFDCEKGLDNMIEAYLFNIVFQIPAPLRN